MRIVSTEKIPIKLWLDDIEDEALEQTKNLANLPFAFHHIAIMPDAHLGYGMPIGGVLATKNVIIPNAVGVDIGCGMCAVKTSLTEIDTETLKKVMSEIRKAIPVGFNKHKSKQDNSLMPKTSNNMPIVSNQYEKARKQIGTLGGGNHFVEIQKGSDNHIWIMLHSGSRNIGKQVADYYNRKAEKLNEKRYGSVPKLWELAYLVFDSGIGQQYFQEMKYCVNFALANRRLMMDTVINIFCRQAIKIEFDEMINIAHNYASVENHFEQEVIVHRKGATQAKKDQIGIIPGSQGSASYIIKGKGNPDSFESCSHGAGRTMSRNRARKELSLEKEKEELDKKGILHSIRHIKDLDEAPGSYKNINIVMENQKDLVDILIELKPLAVIKG